MCRARVLVGLMAGLLCAGTALGGIITTEGFEGYALAALNGCNGGTNWNGAWVAGSQGATRRANVEDLATYNIPPHTGTRQLHIWGTGSQTVYRTPFLAGQLPAETTLDTQMYLLIPHTTTGLGTNFIAIRMGTNTNTQIIDISFNGTDKTVTAEYDTGTNPIVLGYWDGSVHAGYPTLPDARTQWVSFEILADRTNMKMDVVYAGIKIGDDVAWRKTGAGNVIDRFAFFGKTGSDTGSQGGWYADDIRIEGTPEPGSLIVWGCAALLMMFRRRWS